jgi:mono/diheme cytochrome c family protein
MLGTQRSTSLAIVLFSCHFLAFGVWPDSGAQTKDAKPKDIDKTAKASPRWTEFEKNVQPFFAKHCTACHGAKGVEADAPLDQFPNEASLDKNMVLLEKVVDMLSSGQMPPKKRPQPTKEELEPVLAWLKSYTAAVDCNGPRNPGRVTIRRLNRAEYNNTIRDLLAIELRPADTFPLDDAGYGFDNIADVLSLSPLLVEKYLDTASLVLEKAIFVQPVLPAPMKRWDAATAEGTFAKGDPKAGLESSPIQGKATRVGRVFNANGEIFAEHIFPSDGTYTFRLRAYSSAGGNKERPQATFLLDGKKLTQFNVREDQRNTSDYASKPISVNAGKHKISVAMLNGSDPKAAEPNGPKLGVIWFEVEGPLAPTVDRMPESYKRIFVATPSAKLTRAEAAEKILRNFATRAFRRPVRDDEMTRLMKLWTKGDKDGRTFERSIHFALQAVLVSPHFLFRMELDPQPGENGIHTLTEFELATRLSYFLWSSMPDEELFALAGKGKLRANLDAQIRRMLKDARSQSLIDNFAGQWLQLRLMETVVPDAKKYPNFDTGLRSAMIKETQMFLNTIIQEDRSILDMIDADFTFVNERLAKHYGIADVKGPEFRRIKLPMDQRGGLLLHASILTITSYPERTSPVQRGRWVLETFLNDAPPPPPADVPELPKDEKVLKKASLRQLMVEHRTNPNCAACHARMDPIGFALENYDAVGAWRTKDGNDEPIDASGELPDGRKFNGPRELRDIIKKQPERFSRALTEKLLTYALGRGLERYDRCVVDDIVGETQSNGYRFSAVVTAIVKSEPFQKRK